jgi:hypothetical protein
LAEHEALIMNTLTWLARGLPDSRGEPDRHASPALSALFKSGAQSKAAT